MAFIIQVSDLPTSIQANELIDLMVDGANANAARVAPCLVATDPEPTDDQLAEARMVLVGAVRRWAAASDGAYEQMSAGPFSVSTDTRRSSGFNLWPSEIDRLQDICGGKDAGKAFSVDTLVPIGPMHADICSLNFGATYCSCGASLTLAEPLWEV